MGDRTYYHLALKDVDAQLVERIVEAIEGSWGRPDDSGEHAGTHYLQWNEIYIGSSHEMVVALQGVMRTEREFRYCLSEDGYYGGPGLITTYIPSLGLHSSGFNEEPWIGLADLGRLLELEQEVATTTGVADPNWLRTAISEAIGLKHQEAWKA